MDISNSIHIRLVQAVKKYPCLYDSSLPEYYKLESTEEAWIDVAIELSSTPDICKTKWRCFRSSFLKGLRQINMGELVRPHYLHEHMQFLIPYLHIPCNQERRAKRFLIETERHFANNNKHIKANKNVDNEVAFEYCTDNSVQENSEFISADCNPIQQYNCSSNNRKRSMSVAVEETDHSKSWETTRSDENNPKRLFLLSLLPDLEEMDNAQMRLFKRNITTLINGIFDDTIT